MAFTRNEYPDIATASGTQGSVPIYEGQYGKLVDLLELIEFSPRMLAKYADVKDPISFFEEMGKWSVTNSATFYRFEKGYHNVASKIIAKGSNVGNTFTVTIEANSDNQYQIQKKDTLIFGTLGRGYVTDFSNGVATVTAKWDKTPGFTFSTISVGSYCSVSGNGNSRQSVGGRQTFVSKPTMFQAGIQTQRETFTVEGDGLTNPLQVMGPDGTKYWFEQMWMDAMVDCRKKIALTLMFNGSQNTAIPVLDPDTLLDVPFSNGLISDIRENGIYMPRLIGSSWSIAEIDNLNLQMDNEGSPNDNIIWCGNVIEQDISNSITDVMKMNGAVSYDSLSKGGNGGKERAVELGFDTFYKGGRTFHLKKMDMFNDPQVTNLPGMKFNQMALILPMNKVLDGKGKQVDSVALRYRVEGPIGGKGATSRKYKQTFKDWSNIDNAKDINVIETLTECGLETNLMHRAVLIETV